MWSEKYLRSTKFALAACVIAALPVGAMANNTAQNLAKIEARGLASVGAERMASLASPAAVLSQKIRQTAQAQCGAARFTLPLPSEPDEMG